MKPIATVSSFPQLHAAFARYMRDSRWTFRGHASVSWALVPKAGRSPIATADDISMFKSWKRRAVEFVHRMPENDWDWLAVAQHHGLATRLLDWSVSPLVAAYFAVREEQPGPAVVFAHYSERHFTSATYPDLRPDEIRRFRPIGYAARLTRQGGVFTAHDPPIADLLNQLPKGDRLESVEISMDFRKQLRLELAFYGINEMTLFPDLDGLASFVNWWTANRSEFNGSQPFPDSIGEEATET